jgi:hypothetical protein
MNELTIPADRLIYDLEPGDKIVEIDGRPLDPPHEVLLRRVGVGPDRRDAVALVNPSESTTGVEWNLYPADHVKDEVTVERGEVVERRPRYQQPEAAARPVRMIRRTRYGLTLTSGRPIEGTNSRRGWETEDGQYEIVQGWAMTFCDGPHPMRWKDDNGVLHTGYCHGDEEHPYIVGWVIAGPDIPGFPQLEEPNETFDEAWATLAHALKERDDR